MNNEKETNDNDSKVVADDGEAQEPKAKKFNFQIRKEKKEEDEKLFVLNLSSSGNKKKKKREKG